RMIQRRYLSLSNKMDQFSITFRFLFFAITLLTSIKGYSQINYKEGDTLSVVALSGVNIRQEAGINHNKVSKLDNGELVIVQMITNKKDSIDFNGHWVKVLSIKGAINGYIFDAFLSKYRVVNNLSIAKNFAKHHDFVDGGLPELLTEYSEQAFNSSNCNIEYTINSYGESYYRIIITSFNEDCRLIKHQFSEGSKCELELFNARPSESFYLVKNILKQLPQENMQSTKINQNAIMFPKSLNYRNCGVISEHHECLIQIYAKKKGVISILFKFPCC
ncbi:MAG: SH3 domain-containing protein, partial [Reichenbachiella sp.]